MLLYSRAYSRTPSANHWTKARFYKNPRITQRQIEALPTDFYQPQTPEQRESLAFCPTGFEEGQAEDQVYEYLMTEVRFFVVAEQYLATGTMCPPIVYAVCDCHQAARMPSPPISTGMWEGPVDSPKHAAYPIPLDAIQGRLVTYLLPSAATSEECHRAGAGAYGGAAHAPAAGRRARRGTGTATVTTRRWCDYVKRSYDKSMKYSGPDDDSSDDDDV